MSVIPSSGSFSVLSLGSFAGVPGPSLPSFSLWMGSWLGPSCTSWLFVVSSGDLKGRVLVSFASLLFMVSSGLGFLCFGVLVTFSVLTW